MAGLLLPTLVPEKLTPLIGVHVTPMHV